MSLDKLLKENAERLEQALKRRPFENVDERIIKFPEEARERRMVEVKARIGDLSRRKEEALASYDRAIALEQAELESLKRQKSPTVPPEPTKPKPESGRRQRQ